MADQNNNTHVDTLELDPADGKQYIEELRDRLLDLLSPAQSIDEVKDRLHKLYPENDLVETAIEEANKQCRHHSSSSGASFTGTLQNITSLAVARVSNLVRDGIAGNRIENELTKYKCALIQYIINDVLKATGDFVRRQGYFIITRSDIRIRMQIDEALSDLFLRDDKSLPITENHLKLARVNCAERTSEPKTYKQRVQSMIDSENSSIRHLKLIVKVLRAQLHRYPDIEREVQILFCNIDDLLVLSNLLLSSLEDALELVGQEDEIPYVGSELLELAQAKEFDSYYTFAYLTFARGSRNEWRNAYKKILSIVAARSEQNLSDPNQWFYLALRDLLPNYMMNTIAQFYEYFRNITDLHDLSKQNNNEEDESALKDTISILNDTMLKIDHLLETEVDQEDIEPNRDDEHSHISGTIEPILRRKLDAALQFERDSPLPYMPPPEMYRFSEPDCRENIIFENSQNGAIPDIHHATLPKLVERLTYHKYHPNIVDTFLTTYRAFISNPSELLDLLIERFRIPDPPVHVLYPEFIGSPDDLPECQRITYKLYIKRFRQEYSKPVKMRVINVLKSWIKNHYYDFERHPTLLEKLNSFLDDVYHNEKVLRGLIVPIKKALVIRKDHRTQSQRDDVAITMSEQPPPILWWAAKHDEPEKFDILTLHPVEFARQLTIIEFDLFRAIKPSELINVCDLDPRSKKENKYESSNSSRLTRHFTLLSYWIRKCIVETEDFDKRSAIYNRSIEIMAVLRDLNNYTGLLSIGSAIESAPISRLPQTRDTLTNTTKKVLNDYRELTEDHQKKLQQELKRCNPPCIPYLGSYQTKLIHAKEGNKTFMDELDPSAISPTLSTDEFNSSFSNSPATPISPRTPLTRGTFTPMNYPPPLSATSTLQNHFFGVPQPRMINFKKQRIRADLVAEISNYQNPPYCLRVQPQIRQFIENIDSEMTRFAISLDPKSSEVDDNYWADPTVSAMTKRLDDYLFKQSERIEPRDCQKPPRSKSKLPDFWKSPGVKIH